MIEIPHFLLEVSDDVIDVELSFTDALRIILDKLQHDLDHATLIVLLIIIMQPLQFHKTLEVVVPFLKVYHFQEVVLDECRVVLGRSKVEILGGLLREGFNFFAPHSIIILFCTHIRVSYLSLILLFGNLCLAMSW